VSEAEIGLVLVCEAAEVAPGEIKRVTPPGLVPLAVFHLEDGFYVTDDTCTHGQASLAEGCIEDGEVECPAHGGRFEIRTGEAVAFPAAAPLRCYPAQVRDGKIYAEVAVPPAVTAKS